MQPASACTLACLAALAGLVAAEWFSWRGARIVCKLLASSAFVAVALALSATASTYGQLLLLALLLSWVGDACLLSSRGTLFLAGLAAFLLAHLAFAAAFAQGALDPRALAVALPAMGVAGVLTLRWLWPRLDGAYRVAVAAYVAAIVAMCTLALASSAALNNWQVALGAIGFAASDLAVARDQFVVKSRMNRLWGLPLYYLSQLVLAWSLARHVTA